MVLTKTFGTSLLDRAVPGTAAFTAFQLASGGSFEKLAGSLPLATAVHGPLTVVACSHELLYLRYSVLLAVCSKRSQFVFSAYRRSSPSMGLQIASPSRLTRI